MCLYEIKFKVYCPIHPFNSIQNNSISNIDANSCYVDLDNVGDGADIYAIFGELQSNVLNVNDHRSTLYCDVDLLTSQNGIGNQNSICNDVNFIGNALSKISTNQSILKLSDPNSNKISCQNDADCIIHISQQLMPLNTISCPNGGYNCYIMWYEYVILVISQVY